MQADAFVLTAALEVYTLSPPPPGHSSLFPMEDGFPDDERSDQGLAGLGSPHFQHQNGERVERYSRKVFVGGLPPDIDEGEHLGCLFVCLFLPSDNQGVIRK